MPETTKLMFVGIIGLLIGTGIGYSVIPHEKQMTETPSLSSTNTHTMHSEVGMENAETENMHSAMTNMMAGLHDLSGDEFDEAFLQQMIVHHEGAVMMAEAALTDAKHKEIKDLAKNIITAQNKEIEQMKSWQKSWYNQ